MNEQENPLPPVFRPSPSGTPPEFQQAQPMFATNDLAALTQYWVARRVDLEKQVEAIEKFLGFVTVSESLAVRVSKLELFLGIKG